MNKTFCLSTGCCGSKYLSDLLLANNVTKISHDDGPIDDNKQYYFDNRYESLIVDSLRKRRNKTLFDSSQHLFALVKPLHLAFPDARFIHLHRDGRDFAEVAMSRGWFGETDIDRIFCSCDSLDRFQKICRYWAKVNQRIRSDLSVVNAPVMSLSFSDLMGGHKLGTLADFLAVNLIVPSVSVSDTIDPDTAWFDSLERHRDFWVTCGEEMSALGYHMSADDAFQTLEIQACTSSNSMWSETAKCWLPSPIICVNTT